MTALPSARLLARGVEGYPRRLLDLREPPARLHVLGDWPREAPAVAVVGTRDATAYGERVTRELVHALGRAGVVVISGMARGIDAAAHRAALEHGSPTVAVLGTGIDVPYPVAHGPLHRELATRAAVVSEQPPGRRAFPGCFPRRNRLIAALADVTLVVEAGPRSGALITATHALELGRAVAAVPGPIDMPQHRGANELLRDGAQVIASPDDLLALLGLSVAVPAAPRLEGDEHAVWSALGGRALDLDALTTLSALPAERCLAAVTTLELRGVVECALTGEIRRR
jgi:DNA processing protein